MRATREFQEATVGAPELSRFHQRDEMYAWASLLGDEAVTADYNVLSGSPAKEILYRWP
jgi:hypothetical protein